MNIKKVSVLSINEYPFNAKIHTNEQLEIIVNSIKEYGFTQPLVLDENNEIIIGHGRFIAAIRLNMTEVPCVILENLTEPQKKKLRIKDNSINAMTGFDMDMLALELRSLENIGDEIIEFGIPSEQLDKMLEIGDSDNDDAEPKKQREKPQSKTGDIWILGEHKILVGDSYDEKNIKKLLKNTNPRAKIHCITDPPYGINYQSPKKTFEKIQNDNKIINFTPLAKKYTNGYFICWTGQQVVDKWIKIVKKTFEKITNVVIWHKGGGGLGDTERTLLNDYEILLISHRGNKIYGNRGGSVWYYQEEKRKKYFDKMKKSEILAAIPQIINSESIWRIGKDNNMTYLHPTQKPVAVNEKVLSHFTARNDFVLDLFLGSGSNLIACQKMGRKMRAIEICPQYADVAIDRWVEITGETPINQQTKEQWK